MLKTLKRILKATAPWPFLIVFGLGVWSIVDAWNAYSITKLGKSKPTTISAVELIKNGPPRDNIFVHLTDIQITDDYLHDSGDADPDDAHAQWKRIWIKVLPIAGTETKGGKPIIVTSNEIQNEHDLARFENKHELNCIVLNSVLDPDVLPDSETAGQNDNFPRISGTNAWILKEQTGQFYTSITSELALGVVLSIASFFLFRV